MQENDITKRCFWEENSEATFCQEYIKAKTGLALQIEKANKLIQDTIWAKDPDRTKMNGIYPLIQSDMGSYEFGRRLNDESEMPIGIHKGKKMKDVPADHLLFLYDNVLSKTDDLSASASRVYGYIFANKQKIKDRAELERKK